MDSEAKASPPKRPNQKRSDQDKASVWGGSRRGRGKGNRLGQRRGKDCKNPDMAHSMGYRFPDSPATDSQDRELGKIAVDYLRKMALHRFGGFSAETLAESIGLGKRRTTDLVKEVSERGRDETVELAKTVLHGMYTGRIAGVLGTMPTKDSRELFRLVNTVADREVKEDTSVFRMWKAAFSVDYLVWEKRRTAWLYKSNARPKSKI